MSISNIDSIVALFTSEKFQDALNAIEELIIENQKIRKDNYITLENETSDELIRLTRALNETSIQRDEMQNQKEKLKQLKKLL